MTNKPGRPRRYTQGYESRSIVFDRSVLASLDAYARRLKLTRSEVVVALLRASLDAHARADGVVDSEWYREGRLLIGK